MEEISNEDFSDMDKYWKQGGWLAFKTNEIDINDLPKENATVEANRPPHSIRGQFCSHFTWLRVGKRRFPSLLCKNDEHDCSTIAVVIPRGEINGRK